MALDISKLVRMNEFSLKLESLGTVRCLSLNTDHISQANKKNGSSVIGSHDFVRWLFGEIARRPVEGSSDKDDPSEGVNLTPEELDLVTDGELEEFSEKLIQKNKYLFNTYKGSDIERSVDETACDFLVRAFRHHASEQKAQWERMTEPLSKSLFASSTVEAMQRNLGLSTQFQDTIDKYARAHSGVEQIFAEKNNEWEKMTNLASQPSSASAAIEAMQRNHDALDQLRDAVGKHAFDLPNTATSFAGPNLEILNSRMPELHIPKNPIHETNEKLGRVVKQIEDLQPMTAQAAQLIRSMNDTALRMQADYIENARAAGRQTKIAIWIAAISLLVSAVGLVLSSYFSYQSYVDAKASDVQSNAQIKAFQSEIRELIAAQREERVAILKSVNATPSVSSAPVKR